MPTVVSDREGERGSERVTKTHNQSFMLSSIDVSVSSASSALKFPVIHFIIGTLMTRSEKSFAVSASFMLFFSFFSIFNNTFSFSMKMQAKVFLSKSVLAAAVSCGVFCHFSASFGRKEALQNRVESPQ